MRIKLIGFVVGAAMLVATSVPAVGSPGAAFADAPQNDHNCLGAISSLETPPGVGAEVREITQSGTGAVAGVVGEILASCGD